MRTKVIKKFKPLLINNKIIRVLQIISFNYTEEK